MGFMLNFILDGVLIIVASAMDDDGQYYGNINDNTQNVVALLSHLWEEMVLEGRITLVCVNTFNSIPIVTCEQPSRALLSSGKGVPIHVHLYRSTL